VSVGSTSHRPVSWLPDESRASVSAPMIWTRSILRSEAIVSGSISQMDSSWSPKKSSRTGMISSICVGLFFCVCSEAEVPPAG